jgi:hypothetical protein
MNNTFLLLISILSFQLTFSQKYNFKITSKILGDDVLEFNSNVILDSKNNQITYSTASNEYVGSSVYDLNINGFAINGDRIIANFNIDEPMYSGSPGKLEANISNKRLQFINWSMDGPGESAVYTFELTLIYDKGDKLITSGDFELNSNKKEIFINNHSLIFDNSDNKPVMMFRKVVTTNNESTGIIVTDEGVKGTFILKKNSLIFKFTGQNEVVYEFSTSSKILKQQDKQVTDLLKMIENKEYYKSYVAFNALPSDLKINFDAEKIKNNWLFQKNEIDSLYSLYTKDFGLIKQEYYLNRKEFKLKNKLHIIQNEINVDADTYVERKLKSLESDILKQADIIKNLYVYTQEKNQHMITPVGVQSNYSLSNRISTSNILSLIVKYDTLLKSHFGELGFKDSTGSINTSGYIINDIRIDADIYKMPFKVLLNEKLNLLTNQSSVLFVQENYPQLTINLDYYKEIPLLKTTKAEYPGADKKNIQYEELKNKFKLQESFVNKFKGAVAQVLSYNFYNPSILYFVKKLYPDANSIIFVKYDDREKLNKELRDLALYVNYSDGYYKNRYFGSIIPLQKNVVEFKNNKLLIYDRQGNYKEIDVSVLPEGTVSISDLKIESLEFDEPYIKESYYRCPFIFYEKQIGIQGDYYNPGYNIEDRDYYYNDNLLFQVLPLYSLKNSILPNLITLSEVYGYGSSYPDISIDSYLKIMLKYAEHKKNGDFEKANKSLLKAEKEIEGFKKKYSSLKF